MNKPFILFVIGMTNSGKSRLMDIAKTVPRWGTVEVGRMMRAKYPPSYFQGQASPTHTAAEAWAMCETGIYQNSDKEIILVDGQPRDLIQADKCIRIAIERPARFLVVHASAQVRLSRAIERDGANLSPEVKDEILKTGKAPAGEEIPGALDLALQRMNNDYKNGYDVLAKLLVALPDSVSIVDTSHGISEELWIKIIRLLAK